MTTDTSRESVERAASHLTKISDASKRKDGSDTPLGKQRRAVAAMLTALLAERDAALVLKEPRT